MSMAAKEIVNCKNKGAKNTTIYPVNGHNHPYILKLENNCQWINFAKITVRKYFYLTVDKCCKTLGWEWSRIIADVRKLLVS